MTEVNSRSYRIIGLLVSLPLLVLAGWILVGRAPTATAESPSRSKHGLEGTWRIEVTPFDCVTGTERPSVATMISFERGGTLTESASMGVFQPGQRGPGHGVWQFRGNYTYEAVFEAFINFTTAASPPAPGFTQGMQRVTQTIRVDGDQFAADASAEFFDVGGNLVNTLCSRANGSRMSLGDSSS